MTLDGTGNIYFTDMYNHCVRKVSPSGIITTVAGAGTAGYSGDGGPATSAQLYYPSGLALDGSGNIYIADEGNNRIRLVQTIGAAALSIVTTSPLPQGTVGVAYSQTLSANGGASPYTWSVASGSLPGGLTLAGGGTISGTPTTAGSFSFTVQVKDSAAATASTTFALTITASVPPSIATSSPLPAASAGVAYSQTLSATGGSAPYTWSVTAGSLPGGLTLSAGGTVSGTPTTAGSYSFTIQVRDSASATATKAFTLVVVAGGSSIITTVAGTGTAGYSGDGGPATSAQLYDCYGVTLDGSGNMYIADWYNNRIRKVSPSGIITTVAGTGTAGYSGDGGPATSAQLYDPYSVAVDGSGNLFIADEFNYRVRKVSPSGTITTVAGTGVYGYSGDGGPATSAQIYFPHGIVLDGSGNLYFSDSYNHRIRKVSSSGIITTVAGTGTAGYSGDGGPATSAQLNTPHGVALDGSGNLYIGDYSNNRVRKVSPSGIITSVAGTGAAGYSGDGGPATSAQLYYPDGVFMDGSGNIYIADESNHRVRKVSPSGIIATVAGNGTRGYSGDGGPPTNASFTFPSAVVLDGSGNLYIADSENHRIRLVQTAGAAALSVTTTSPLPQGTVGVAYSQTLGATGGASPYTWSVTSGALPGGLTLSRGGTISGTPATAGAYSFTVQVRDSAAATASATFALTISLNIAQINSGGIVNNASYNLGSSAVAPGEIVAVFGANLTDGTSCLPPSCNPTFGSNGRLNTTMAGAQATVNGIPAPIFYAAPAQLGIQIPFEVTGTSATVVVSVGGQASAPATVTAAAVSPGIFTTTSDGRGAGAITHVNGSAVTPQNPAQRGEVVILYATGLGQVAPAVSTGALPAGASSTVSPVVLTIGGIVFIPDFAGQAGCCVGLNQINARIPNGVSPGNAVPVVLSVGVQSSNTATIAVQ